MRVFVDERSDPSESNDADSLRGENVLTTISKEPDLAVVARIGARRPLRFGMQASRGWSHHSGAVRCYLLVVREPDVARYGVSSEYQCSNGRTIKNVEQGWITPAVRCHVIGGERHAVGSEVIVDGKICKPFLGALPDTVSYELWSKSAVPANAQHIVNAILGQEQAPPNQPETSFGCQDGCPDYGAMLVGVVTEQVCLKVVHDHGREPQADCLPHCV